MSEPGISITGTHETAATVGAADVVVGVAALGNLEAIGAVLGAARRGAADVSAGRTVIAFADGSGGAGAAAPPAAPEATAAAPGPDAGGVPIVDLSDGASLRGRPPVGKAAAVRAILAYARQAGAKACVVLDAEMLGATPAWVGALLDPVLAGRADYTAPVYVQPPNTGAITSGIAYPVTRALYGRRLRFPLGGDFACAPPLLERWLARPPVWETDLARTGAEHWLGTQAVLGGFRLRQVRLGFRRPPPGAPAEDLTKTLARALGALFTEVERNAAAWQRVRGSEPVETSGTPPDGTEPAAVDAGRAIEAFRLGQGNLAGVWGRVLPPTSLLELKRLARLPDAAFRFADALLARIVYDFAVAYRVRSISQDHLLASFTPIYLGWFGSVVGELQGADARAVEARVERLCQQYEAEKPYLIARWRWPDRFGA